VPHGVPIWSPVDHFAEAGGFARLPPLESPPVPAQLEFAYVLEGISEGLCVLDREYRFRYLNPKAEAILDRPRAELLGNDARALYPLESEPLERVRRALESGERAEFETFSPTFGRWFVLNVYPIRDGVAILFHDSSEQKRTEEDHQRLVAIVESSEDAIISKSLEGVITSWNAGARRLFGYEAAEIVGKPITTLMPPEHKNDMTLILDRIRRGERVEHFETVRVTKHGDLIPVSLSVSAVKDASGKVIGAAKIARDITERKHAEAELERLYREAQKAIQVRDTFISVAGHEFRTPLNALTLQLYNLERALKDPAQRAAVQRATAEVQRLSALTGQLLDVARMASGGFSVDRAPMDLSELAAEVVHRMEEGASRVGSRFGLRVPGPVIGEWDRLRLDQVITNLASNALKFGRGSPIEVSVEAEGALARVRVRDHGIGVPTKDRERIFERFERAVSDQSFGGLGLGLWIARQIVEAHSGRIGVESPEDGGAAFFFELER
jgi:PAS domain S-box-containing protein